MVDREGTSQKQTAAKGFMVLTVAMLAVKVLSVIYTPGLNLILGEDGYGVYSQTYTIFTFFYTVANSGVQSAIAKITSELEARGNYRDANRSFKISRTLFMIFGLLIASILFFFAGPISSAFNSSRSSLAIMCLAPGLVFTSMMCAYKGYFQGIGNMTPISIALVGEQVLNIVFSMYFASLLIGYGGEYGAAGGTTGTVIGSLAASIYLMWAYKRLRCDYRVKNTKPHTKRMSGKSIARDVIKYSVPITVASALQQSSPLIDVKLVSARLIHIGVDPLKTYAQYGFLNLYNTLISVPMAVIGALATTVLPAISRVNAVSSKKNLRMSIRSAYRVAFMIAMPCAVGLSALALPITKILGYDPVVADLLVWGGWVVIFFALTLIQTSILQGMGKMTLVTIYSIVGIVVKIVVNYILIGRPGIGIIGAVWGTGLSYLVMAILFQNKINKSLGKIRVAPCYIKPLISGIAMGVITKLSYGFMTIVVSFMNNMYLVNLISALISIVLSAVTYLLIMIFIGGITRADLKVLPNKLVKFIPNGLMEIIR